MSFSPHRFSLVALVVACVFASAAPASAQTDNQLLLPKWPENVWGETNDHIIYSLCF